MVVGGTLFSFDVRARSCTGLMAGTARLRRVGMRLRGGAAACPLGRSFIAGESQRGAVLPSVIILMIVIAAFAISGMSDTALQSRMAGNMRDRDMAFQAAEAALRAGEAWAEVNAAGLGLNTLMEPTVAAAWNGASPAPSGRRANLYPSDADVGLAQDPVFYAAPPQTVRIAMGENSQEDVRFIEMVPVVARGVGGTDTSVVILRSTLALVE